MNVSDSPSGDSAKPADVVESAVTDQAVTPDANGGAAVTSDAVVQQGANKPELSLDEVIKAAIKPGEGAADTPADGKGTQEPGSETVADEAKVEKTEAEKEAEEDAKVPFHKHPRWQKKLEVERDLKTKLSEREQELEPLRVKAGQLDEIGNFMKSNSLTPEEMSQGMEIMALMKQDPAKALEALLPQVELLEIATGKRFPQDIQERVDSGVIDAAAAKELTQTRFAAKANEARAEVATEQLQNTNTQTLAAGMKTAVQTWEAELKTRDPDYSHKQSFVIDRTRVLAQANPPKSADDAVKLAQQAYDDVTAQMKRIIQPKPATAATVTSGQSSTRSDANPQNLEDIVRRSLAR